MKSHKRRLVTISGIVLVSFFLAAQTQSETSSASRTDLSVEYPRHQAGILIQSPDWVPISPVMPSKVRTKRGLAASLSYGAVSAKMIAEYAGLHAATQIAPGQPVICICHVISLPGDPVLVRLHSKKASRELDGGRMRVLPVVGGQKMLDANKTDLLPVDISHPEDTVWLVRPQQPLPAGEYALMLGTQNVNIFPFTITDSSDAATLPSKD
jgi:hypothetical protein